jgi:hypothetical protein
MTIMTTDAEPWEVQDHDRMITFTGVLLGDASSQSPGKDRWTEVAIYRTAAGKYIVEKIGKSRVPGETDRCSAEVCETAAAVVEAMHGVDERGGKYMTHLYRELAGRVAEQDHEFSRAYRTYEVA